MEIGIDRSVLIRSRSSREAELAYLLRRGNTKGLHRLLASLLQEAFRMTGRRSRDLELSKFTNANREQIEEVALCWITCRQYPCRCTLLARSAESELTLVELGHLDSNSHLGHGQFSSQHSFKLAMTNGFHLLIDRERGNSVVDQGEVGTRRGFTNVGLESGRRIVEIVSECGMAAAAKSAVHHCFRYVLYVVASVERNERLQGDNQVFAVGNERSCLVLTYRCRTESGQHSSLSHGKEMLTYWISRTAS